MQEVMKLPKDIRLKFLLLVNNRNTHSCSFQHLHITFEGNALLMATSLTLNNTSPLL